MTHPTVGLFLTSSSSQLTPKLHAIRPRAINGSHPYRRFAHTPFWVTFRVM